MNDSKKDVDNKAYMLLTRQLERITGGKCYAPYELAAEVLRIDGMITGDSDRYLLAAVGAIITSHAATAGEGTRCALATIAAVIYAAAQLHDDEADDE